MCKLDIAAPWYPSGFNEITQNRPPESNIKTLSFCAKAIKCRRSDRFPHTEERILQERLQPWTGERHTLALTHTHTNSYTYIPARTYTLTHTHEHAHTPTLSQTTHYPNKVCFSIVHYIQGLLDVHPTAEKGGYYRNKNIFHTWLDEWYVNRSNCNITRFIDQVNKI